jgi:hypothetical protein
MGVIQRKAARCELKKAVMNYYEEIGVKGFCVLTDTPKNIFERVRCRGTMGREIQQKVIRPARVR